MKTNLILLSDSYKLSHFRQPPKNTEIIYSYFEARKGGKFNKTIFFGLQYFIKEYLLGTVITKEMVQEAKELADVHVGPGIFNEDGWMKIVNKFNGKLPIRIKAVPEGTLVNIDNVLMTVENTDPEFAWLTNYLETLLVEIWYPSTVCTNSFEYGKIVERMLEKSGDIANLPFSVNDFGVRGSTSPESAALGGAAHLVNFKGTDNIPAIAMLKKYYGSNCAGFSIPAMEHSTVTSWGRDGEKDAFENMLDSYKTPLVAIVVDSYDMENAVDNIIGKQLKEKIMTRGGKVVIRPDSGDPKETLPWILRSLEKNFGVTINSKGYKEIPPYLGVIQGDSVSLDTIDGIYQAVLDAGFSANCVVTGSGGGLLQNVNRDTQRFAFKCAYVTVNGEGRNVFKEPKTDLTKKSKSGRLKLVKAYGNGYHTANDTDALYPDYKDELVTVFENGELLVDYDLETIRANVAKTR